MKIVRFSELGRKVVAVGRNYADHAKELGNAVSTTKPLLFMKPSSSYITAGQSIEIPLGCSELHHEIELGAVISKQSKRIQESEAMNFIGKFRKPETLKTMFDTSLPVSELIPLNRISDPGNINLWCKVNGELRQNGCTKDMIFSLPFLVSYISQYFTLEEGDLILTGTPAGVGPVKSGDVITGGIPDVIEISFPVIQRT
ncbi:probable acylpyruvase FAHD1, mitochondrial [Eurytemora carolleeae]|uniref:probable acylpyruvase FAHD1, mitochondrial n=1 Tax=Eurytemora carolleeae TaxID=1294199 RepID=UPI000C778585|nr:probable acylpyruvase FAHD1, mitochondrial [Eurytemora carolleeae]|eukprot:XP_023340040.1 probable acylpyruvase FAHD1, mitochondrial [Eurytemora affinis]